jgi:hypothetical protein
MGKTLKYVKDFDFSAKPCNYAYGGGVSDGLGTNRGASKSGEKVKNARAGDAMQKVRRDVDRNDMPRQRKFNAAPVVPPATLPPVAPRLGAVPPAPLPAQALQAGLANAGQPFKKGGKVNMASGGYYGKGGKATAGAKKVGKVMGEFKAGKLHSGSKKGPAVTSKKQAIAIAMSEAGKSKRNA